MNYDKQAILGGSYPQASLAPPKECTPASIIDVQMGHLDSRIDVVLKLAAALEGKLGKVLRQVDSPPVNKGNLGSAPCTGVILGDALASQSERLQDAINYLSNTLERIEL